MVTKHPLPESIEKGLTKDKVQALRAYIAAEADSSMAHSKKLLSKAQTDDWDKSVQINQQEAKIKKLEKDLKESHEIMAMTDQEHKITVSQLQTTIGRVLKKNSCFFKT